MTKSVSDSNKKKQENVNRAPCPFCKELVISGAKKCRFCKESLDKTGKTKLDKSNFFTKRITPSWPYKLWLLSMLVFLVSIGQNQAISVSHWATVMFISIAVGFVAFLILLASIPGSNSKYGLITLFTFVLFFGILINYDKVATAFGLQLSSSTKSNAGDVNTLLKEHTISPSPTLTISPTKQSQVDNTNTAQSNKIECIGPDGKQFTTTMEECKKLNEKWGKPVDYMTNCNIHSDCGGGTVYMKKSQCDLPCSGLKNNNLVDCYVANRVFKLSKNECDELVRKANEPLNDVNSDNSDWANLQKEIEQGRLQREAEYLKSIDQAIKSNDSMYKSCIASADGAKTRKISWCNSYPMGESYKESCKREAEATYLQAVGNCKSQYY